MFNDTTRTQIQAALEFWVATGDSSRTHPSEHPQIQVFFETNKTLPMTNDEIRDLIFVLNAPVPVTTLPLLAAGLKGISVIQLRRTIRQQGVKPVMGTYVYETSSLLPVIRAIRESYGIK